MTAQQIKSRLDDILSRLRPDSKIGILAEDVLWLSTIVNTALLWAVDEEYPDISSVEQAEKILNGITPGECT